MSIGKIYTNKKVSSFLSFTSHLIQVEQTGWNLPLVLMAPVSALI